MQDFRTQLQMKEDTMGRNKGFEENLFGRLKQLQDENTHEHMRQRDFKISGATIQDLRKQLVDGRSERDRMQREFDDLMRHPFFREQADSTNMKNLEKLQQRLAEVERDIKKTQDAIRNHETRGESYADEYENVIGERERLKE